MFVKWINITSKAHNSAAQQKTQTIVAYSVISYDICLALSDLLHSVWQSLGPSMLLQMALFHSFLWLSNIPIYVFNIVAYSGRRVASQCHQDPWLLLHLPSLPSLVGGFLFPMVSSWTQDVHSTLASPSCSRLVKVGGDREEEVTLTSGKKSFPEMPSTLLLTSLRPEPSPTATLSCRRG